MKIFCSALLAFCFIITVHAQPVKKHGSLQVSGTSLLNAKGEPVILRGMSFGWHNWWPRFYNKGSVRWLKKDWKATVVRAALGIEPKGAYLEKPEWSKEKIKAVVDAAIKADIYVIIDWHSHNINLQEAKNFFTEMASLYGNHPHVIYEIFNEPDDESWKAVKEYSIELINVIRAIDPDNIILVGSPHWDQDVHLAADDPIRDVTNVMYTLHFYAGTHKQWLRDRADTALKKGLPLFISESAATEATGDGKLDESEWKKWIDWAEARKISWITWSISDKDESCSVLQKHARSDGKWAPGDLKASGIMTREMLRQRANKRK